MTSTPMRPDEDPQTHLNNPTPNEPRENANPDDSGEPVESGDSQPQE